MSAVGAQADRLSGWFHLVYDTAQRLQVASQSTRHEAAGWKGTHMRQTDGDAMEKWVDHYCQEHPLDRVADAAEALVHELER